MFKWLEKKAAQRSAKNVALNTKTLILVANEADKRIVASGGQVNEADQRNALSAQKSLLMDIELAMANGMSLEELIEAHIRPVVDSQEVSEGAKLAINHVLSYKGGSL